MVKVGVHVSIAGSVDQAVDRAKAKGCDVFQIFSRNPRGWSFRPLNPDEITAFAQKISATGLLPVDHMPYLPNLATPREELYKKSVSTLTAELGRCGTLKIPYLVTHLGHHLGDGIAGGRKRVIAAINTALSASDNKVQLLLENTAGEKNSVGSTFEHINPILEGLTDTSRIGICFDTCHAFAAGYDLRTAEGIEDTVHRLDEVIGVKQIKCVHLNDSKGALGSGLDRHEHIGMGSIGEHGFRCFLHNPVFRDLPLICETPVDARQDDEGNIGKVRKLAQ
jgi:deoxyribonuclease-4